MTDEDRAEGMSLEGPKSDPPEPLQEPGVDLERSVVALMPPWSMTVLRGGEVHDR